MSFVDYISGSRIETAHQVTAYYVWLVLEPDSMDPLIDID